MAAEPTLLIIDDRPDAATVLGALFATRGLSAVQVRPVLDAVALADAARGGEASEAIDAIEAVVLRADLPWCPAAELATLRDRAFPGARLILLGLPSEPRALVALGRAGFDDVVEANATGLVTVADALSERLGSGARGATPGGTPAMRYEARPTGPVAVQRTPAGGTPRVSAGELAAAKSRLFGVQGEGTKAGPGDDAIRGDDTPDRETLAMLAHDLREPVRAVRTWLTLLTGRHGDSLTDDVQTLVGQATDATARLSGRLDALIDDARDRPTMTLDAAAWCDADAVLDEVLADLAPLVDEADATVRRAPLPELPMRADHLQRVLQNLIANALRHRSDGAPLIDVAVTDRGDDWLVEVRDNGPGVPEAEQQRIFELFEGGGRGGSGVGLSACKQLVTRYGGRIWVQSNVEAARETGRVGGPGAAFLFTLPRRRMSEVG